MWIVNRESWIREWFSVFMIVIKYYDTFEIGGGVLLFYWLIDWLICWLIDWLVLWLIIAPIGALYGLLNCIRAPVHAFVFHLVLVGGEWGACWSTRKHLPLAVPLSVNQAWLKTILENTQVDYCNKPRARRQERGGKSKSCSRMFSSGRVTSCTQPTAAAVATAGSMQRRPILQTHAVHTHDCKFSCLYASNHKFLIDFWSHALW